MKSINKGFTEITKKQEEKFRAICQKIKDLRNKDLPFEYFQERDDYIKYAKEELYKIFGYHANAAFKFNREGNFEYRIDRHKGESGDIKCIPH